jgi:hypothetical protein
MAAARGRRFPFRSPPSVYVPPLAYRCAQTTRWRGTKGLSGLDKPSKLSVEVVTERTVVVLCPTMDGCVCVRLRAGLRLSSAQGGDQARQKASMRGMDGEVSAASLCSPSDKSPDPPEASVVLSSCLLACLLLACWLARFCTIPLCPPALPKITTTCEVVLSSVRRHAVRWNLLFATQSECHDGADENRSHETESSGAGVGDGYKHTRDNSVHADHQMAITTQ